MEGLVLEGACLVGGDWWREGWIERCARGRDVHGGRVILLVCLGLFGGLFGGRVAWGGVGRVEGGLRRSRGVEAGHD